MISLLKIHKLCTYGILLRVSDSDGALIEWLHSETSFSRRCYSQILKADILLPLNIDCFFNAFVLGGEELCENKPLEILKMT